MLMVLPVLLGEVDLSRMQGGVLGVFDRVGEVVTAARLELASRAGGTHQLANVLLMDEFLPLGTFSWRTWSGTGALPSTPGGPTTDPLTHKRAEQAGGNEVSSGFQYHEADNYFGFGFDGWQSGNNAGIHGFPEFHGKDKEMGFIRRQFPTGRLETLLTSTLHQLDGAITTGA
jgi:hypothetical protein